MLTFLTDAAEVDCGIAFDMMTMVLPSDRSRIDPIDSETTVSSSE